MMPICRRGHVNDKDENAVVCYVHSNSSLLWSVFIGCVRFALLRTESVVLSFLLYVEKSP